MRTPQAVVALDPELLDLVLPADLRARLAGLVELRPPVPVTDYGGPDGRAALAAAEVLVTGWGAPVLDRAALAAAPGLRLIVHAAGSVKEARIDRGAWDRGIAVSSAAEANAVPVAQYTVAAILLAGKRAFRLASDYAGGHFTNVLAGPGDGAGGRIGDGTGDGTGGGAGNGVGTGNAGRTVGVVGASRIGRLVLRDLAGHGFRLLVADPYLDAAGAAALGATAVELDDLVRGSDVVTLHAPLLPETRHLVDDRRLGLMRDGAVLVNTARGGLVDTEALARHCASGRLDAVLDVTEPEPLPPGHPLLRLPNVFVTPHVAGALGSEIRTIGAFAVDEVARWLAGEPLLGAVRADDLGRIA